MHLSGEFECTEYSFQGLYYLFHLYNTEYASSEYAASVVFSYSSKSALDIDDKITEDK